MSIQKLSIANFHSEVPQEYSNFVLQVHELLTKEGYKSKVQLKKHGLSAQYNSPNTKGNALQLIVRDNALHMYLYNIFLYEYNNFLESLPSAVINEFAEYRNCTDSCSPVCAGDRLNYTINGIQYRKCVVGRRFFTIDTEIAAGILSVLQKICINIEICKLTPNLVQDYAHFFDTTPHNKSGNEDKCYCVTFCKDNVYHNGGSHWYPSPDERRIHGIQRVKDGYIQGYLAYSNGEVVGWCNSNTKTDCKEIMNFMRTVNGVPVDECKDAEKIKFVFCFAIAPKMQKMGIATQLLEHVCRDAAAEGFDFIEAQAQKKFHADGFRGMLSMYEKCGFSIYAEQGDKIIVRKILK